MGVPETGVECRTTYNKQGNVNFLIVTRTVPSPGKEPIQQIVYKLSYQEDGSRRGAYYDAKGRLTRYTLVKDGIETVLNENHYPN